MKLLRGLKGALGIKFVDICSKLLKNIIGQDRDTSDTLMFVLNYLVSLYNGSQTFMVTRDLCFTMASVVIKYLEYISE